MNREIKFRGKRLDNREWVEGTPVWSANGRCYMITGVEETQKMGMLYMINGAEETEKMDVLCQIEYAEVDPATVGQYTGITGIDGREICEGDILSVKVGRQYVIFSVSYQDGGFVLIYDGSAYDLMYEPRENITVVGNIHDNPELLENE